MGVAAVLLVLVSGVACFFILKKRKRRRESKKTETISPPASNEDDQAEQVRQGFAKAELGADGEHIRSELPGLAVSKPGEGLFSGYRGQNSDSLPHELKGQDVAELGVAGLPQENLTLSAAPVELPGDCGVELPGSTPPPTNPPSMASSPILRSVNRSPINRSTGPSPLNRPMGSPSPVHQSSRPHLVNRMSTMDSLASSAPSLPSQPSGLSSPEQGPVMTSSNYNEALSPISPIPEGTLGQGGMISLLRGMDLTDSQPRAHTPTQTRDGDERRDARK